MYTCTDKPSRHCFPEKQTEEIEFENKVTLLPALLCQHDHILVPRELFYLVDDAYSFITNKLHCTSSLFQTKTVKCG